MVLGQSTEREVCIQSDKYKLEPNRVLPPSRGSRTRGIRAAGPVTRLEVGPAAIPLYH